MTSKSRAAFVQIVSAEAEIERWDKDMIAPPTYSRRRLVEDLRALGGEAVQTLLAGLKDSDPIARREAARLLGELGREYVDVIVGPLQQATRDDIYSVRSAAAGAVARVAPQKALDAGIHLLHPHFQHVLAMLRGTPQFQVAVEAMLELDSRLARYVAMREIQPEHWSQPGIRRAVEALLDAEDPTTLADAVRNVIRLSSDTPNEALVEAAIRHPELLDGRLAPQLVAHPRRAELVAALVSTLPGDFDRAEERAFEALAELVDDAEVPGLVDCLGACLARPMEYRRRPRCRRIRTLTVSVCVHLGATGLLDPLVSALDSREGTQFLDSLVPAFAKIGAAARERLQRLVDDPQAENHQRSAAERVLERL